MIYTTPRENIVLSKPSDSAFHTAMHFLDHGNYIPLHEQKKNCISVYLKHFVDFFLVYIL